MRKKKLGEKEEGKKKKTRAGRTTGRDAGRDGYSSECLKSVEAGRWLKERKVVKRAWPGGFRRRYFHRDLDLRLDEPQTIRGEDGTRTRRRQKGGRKGMGRTGVRSKVSTGG